MILRLLATLLSGLAASFVACHSPAPDGPRSADVVYVGGDIVTVDAASPRATALAVLDGRIVAVGDDAAVAAWRGPGTRVVDLAGRTMVPGFLDGHSHFINALSVATQANVYAPPFGPGDSIAAVVATLQRLQAERAVPPGDVLIAYGYDGDAMRDGRELTAADLDPHFPDQPVVVQHVSLHGGVLNSAALAKFGITAATVTPPGGIILRKEGSDEPAGLVMENAYLPVHSGLPRPTPDERSAGGVGSAPLVPPRRSPVARADRGAGSRTRGGRVDPRLQCGERPGVDRIRSNCHRYGRAEGLAERRNHAGRPDHSGNEAPTRPPRSPTSLRSTMHATVLKDLRRTLRAPALRGWAPAAGASPMTSSTTRSTRPSTASCWVATPRNESFRSPSGFSTTGPDRGPTVAS